MWIKIYFDVITLWWINININQILISRLCIIIQLLNKKLRKMMMSQPEKLSGLAISKMLEADAEDEEMIVQVF